MKRLWIFFLIFFLLGPVSPAPAAELRQTMGGHEVGIRIDRHPPVVGDNGLEIEIKDPGGRRVTEAQVLVNYYMPPMPRMAPMNYTVPAKLKGDRYQAVMRLIMDGPWIIALKITLDGKTATTKFHINAR